MKVRPKLIKVVVTPVLVLLDEDDNVTELPQDQIVIPAAEWPTYSSERFPREMEELERKLNELNESDAPGE